MRYIYTISLELRDKLESEYDWTNNLHVFKGKCRSISKNLANIFREKGYNTQAVMGYYKNPGEFFYTDTSDWSLDDIDEYDNKIKIYWADRNDTLVGRSRRFYCWYNIRPIPCR